MYLHRLVKAPEELETPEEAELAIQEILRLVENKDEKMFNYVVYGLILQHSQRCNRPDCALTEMQRNFYAQDVSGINNGNSKGKRPVGAKAHLRGKADWNASLLNYLNFQFSLCLNKFPNDAKLRLFHSQFLIERLRNTSLAMSELFHCAAHHAGFVDQFLVFRYRQCVKDSIVLSSKGQGQTYSVAAVLAYESAYKQLRDKIEKVAVAHMQFWSLLWEESPNMQKLVQTGFKILSTMEAIERLWEGLQRMSMNSPKAVRIYAGYCSEVINDGETGQALLARAKEFVFVKSHIAGKRQVDAFNSSKISKDGSPCIVIDSQQGSLGTIIDCNSSLCRTFGYTKKELMGAKLNSLMPEMYAKRHTELLVQDMEYKERSTEGENWKDVSAFGLNHSGYVFPVTIRLVSSPSFLNNSSYVAVFSVDKQLATSTIAFMLLDTKYAVQYVTSSAITLLNLDRSALTFNAIHVSELLPALFTPTNYEKYMSGSGALIEYHLPREDLTFSDRTNPLPLSILRPKKQTATDIETTPTPTPMPTGERRELLCQLQELKMKKFGTVGYSIRLELPKKETGAESAEPIAVNKVLIPKNFQFKYDDVLNKYIRELRDDSQKSRAQSVSEEVLRKRASTIGRFLDLDYTLGIIAMTPCIGPSQYKRVEGQKLPPEEAGDELKRKLGEINELKSWFYAALIPKIRNMSKLGASGNGDPTNSGAGALAQDLLDMLSGKELNYGKGVVTYRLIDGQAVMIDDETSQPSLMHPDHLGNVDIEDEEGRGRRDTGAVSVLTQIRSREAFRLKLMEAAQPRELAILLLTSILLAGCLVAFSILLYLYSMYYMDATKKGLTNLYRATQIMSYVQNSVYYTRDLIILAAGLSTHYTKLDMTLAQYYSYVQNTLTKYNDIIDDLNNNIEETRSVALNSGDFDSLYRKETVNVQSIVLNVYQLGRLYSFPEALVIFESTLFAISMLTASDYIDTTYYIYVIIRNGFNSISAATTTLTTLFYNALVMEEDRNMNIILTIFVIAVTVSVLFLPTVLLFIGKIHAAKENIMRLFLELPAITIKALNTRCEAFLHGLRHDVETDADSVAEDLAAIESKLDTTPMDYVSRRMRKFSNKSEFMKLFSFGVLLFTAVLSAFFAINYTLEKNYRSRYKGMLEEFQSTAELEPVAQMALNYQRECYYNDSTLTILGNSSCSQSLNILDEAYSVTKVLEDLSIKVKLTGASQENEIKTMLKGNLCDEGFSDYVNTTLITCSTFSEGIAKEVRYPLQRPNRG